MATALLAEPAVEFSVFTVIREKLVESADPDPHSVIDAVLDAIPRQHQREAIRQLLPNAVRLEAKKAIPLDEAVPAIRRSKPNDAALAPSSSGMGGEGGRSNGTVSSWSRWDRHLPWLRERVFVADGGREWKFRGDCSAADLRNAAAVRIHMAEANAAAAAQHQRLADLLDAKGIAVVSQLSSIDALRAWNGESE